LSSLWLSCKGNDHITYIEGVGLRIVEDQEDAATTKLVDNLHEQSRLEELLDESKPPYPPHALGRDYLFSTPFRYPPLRYGSRFGRTIEPSLLYASKDINTLIAEAAFYRFVVYHDMAEPPPVPLNTTHTTFSFKYQTAEGVLLHQPPFNTHRSQLAHPGDYSAPQELGSQMRSNKVTAFEFFSARSRDNGINLALFDSSPIKSMKPENQAGWIVETSASETTFLNRRDKTLHKRLLKEYLIGGVLPRPA